MTNLSNPQVSYIKTIIIILIKTLIIIALFWHLISRGQIDINKIKLITELNNMPIVAVSILCFILSQYLASYRLTRMLCWIELNCLKSKTFCLTMIGNFINFVLPGGIGGDIVRGYYLLPADSIKKSQCIGILFMDKAVGVVAMLLMAWLTIIFLLLADKIVAQNLHEVLLSIFMSVGLVLLILLAVTVMLAIESIRTKIQSILKRFINYQSLLSFLRGIVLTIRFTRCAKVILLSLVLQSIALFGITLLTYLFPNPPALEQLPLLAAATLLVLLVNLLPITPGNIGWTEFMAGFAWSWIGIADGAAVLLLWRVITVSCTLPWGLWYIFFGKNTFHSARK